MGLGEEERLLEAKRGASRQVQRWGRRIHFSVNGGKVAGLQSEREHRQETLDRTQSSYWPPVNFRFLPKGTMKTKVLLAYLYFVCFN